MFLNTGLSNLLEQEVADHTGETFGGILNASFGNVPELIIGLQALWHNELRVVKPPLILR